MKKKKIVALATISAIGGLSAIALAQSGSFMGFTTGNLVVSRSVYTGTASTVMVGQKLPPVCPSTAACGTAAATDNGQYPNLTNTNSVWNNNKADGSFGVTSPIFLDQIKTDGTLVNTLAVPSNLLTTSFSSKSELALNLSVDGTAVTFMAYVAPPNALDVSNSNTPGVYDPTNPAGGSYYRAVAQVGANGAIQVTNTNSYSGNNGRAAILAGGQYYMSGNSNNGSGTPANVVSSTGVELATPGQASSTPPMMIGNFSITQVNDPSTGMPYAPDKLGKDNNYRGLTIFNNTLYVTKGSGGNGINTVYQVGTAGTLPVPGTAASAPITILPGFPTTLAKNTGAANPFGIFFANSTTLYVADEGDGTMANAASSMIAGLQKWVLSGGTWKRVYVLQNGLNLGQQYSINNYPTSLNPATDGLRNITGKVNSDGTVTIFGVTSTVSASGDQGADPNKLVAITDVSANTDPSMASGETFTTIRSANAGEVLRGVSFAPTSGLRGAAANVPTVLSAANYGATAIAPGSLATANGSGLATSVAGNTSLPLPTSFGGTSVSVVDSTGAATPAPLLYVSPTQLNFQVPGNVAAGAAQVVITARDGTKSTANVQIAAVAPGIFTLNNAGLVAATALSVATNGTRTAIPTFTMNSDGSIVAAPIPGVGTNSVYLSIYGTGLQAAGTAVTALVNGVSAVVQYAGPQGGFAGLDQVNILLPTALAGKGNVEIQLTAGGIAANPVQVTIQ